jgi:hypothetical protein
MAGTRITGAVKKAVDAQPCLEQLAIKGAAAAAAVEQQRGETPSCLPRTKVESAKDAVSLNAKECACFFRPAPNYK